MSNSIDDVFDNPGLISEADEKDERPYPWHRRTEMDVLTDTTTSSMSSADAAGKVTLTYVYPLETNNTQASQLRNYISEAQSIRRHAASVMRSFDPDQWGAKSPIYGKLKGTWNGEQTSLISGNMSENANKVGEAFAAWESNGYRKSGAEPPKYGSKPYVAVRGDQIKGIWTTDSGRYGISVQLGKTRGQSHDPSREHTFDLLLGGGAYQTGVLDAIDEGEISPGSAEIHERDGEFYIHQTINFDQPIYDWKDLDTWVGVDLGTVSLYCLAVVTTADGGPKGNGVDVLTTEHGPGDELMHERRQQKASLRHLQQSDGYAVASEKLGKRLSRQAEHLEHQYANEIVAVARDHDPAGIVFEDLGGIKGLGWQHLWPYFRFKQTVTYKAHIEGIPTLTLTKGQTRGTSQTCSVCGTNPHDKSLDDPVDEKSGDTGRISRSQYECGECGYGPVDADVNAAINIARCKL